MKEEILKRIPLFSSMPDEEIGILASILESKEIDEGTFVFCEGEPGRRFFIVVEGDVDITKSTIYAQAGNPYGQFFAEDSVKIEQNVIYADGDRYLDLDPAYLQNMIIANNEIHVLITEGVDNTRGGLPRPLS